MPYASPVPPPAATLADALREKAQECRDEASKVAQFVRNPRCPEYGLWPLRVITDLAFEAEELDRKALRLEGLIRLCAPRRRRITTPEVERLAFHAANLPLRA